MVSGTKISAPPMNSWYFLIYEFSKSGKISSLVAPRDAATVLECIKDGVLVCAAVLLELAPPRS